MHKTTRFFKAVNLAELMSLIWSKNCLALILVESILCQSLRFWVLTVFIEIHIELSERHETMLYCCSATEMRAVCTRKALTWAAVHVHYNSHLLIFISNKISYVQTPSLYHSFIVNIDLDCMHFKYSPHASRLLSTIFCSIILVKFKALLSSIRFMFAFWLYLCREWGPGI